MITSTINIVKEDPYLYRFAAEVYQKAYKVNIRKFSTRHSFVMWALECIGPRPTNKHHLYLTSDYDSPAEWRVPSKTTIIDYLNEYS